MTSDHAAPEAPALYRYLFGNTEFDEGRWQLRVEGGVVDLERKPLDVLQYLLRHAGEAVTKEELLSTVWEGRVVVEAVLTNAIGKLRKALRDEEQKLILTLPKVGYRLDAKVSRRMVEYVPDASRLSVGDLVPRRGNWRLEEALARGGDGEVWLARHIKTGQSRVFKFSLDGFRLAGLKREVTVGRLLEQALGTRPDLVHVIDWDFEQAPYFVEFEYGGVSLDTWSEGGSGIETLLLATRLAMFVEVVGTVAAAHGVGVLHKDLKPANLLVYGESGDWHLRVADFGSSRVFEMGVLENLGITRLGFTQTQAISPETGTPLYMAPEVLAGQSPTIKSDVYALGITLYQLIIGDFRHPLSAGWENDIADPLLRQDIADAANGDPEKRLDSAAELAERIRNLNERRQKAALEAAVKDRIVVAERRAALARARRPWIAAAMVVLIAGMAVSLFYAHRSHLEAQKALAASSKASALNKFLLQDLVGASDPFKSGDKELTLRQALSKAESKISARFAKQPEVEADVRIMLGQAYGSRGEWALATQQYDKAIQVIETHPEVDQGLALETRMHEASILLSQGRLTEMGKVMDPVLKAADEGKILDARLRTQVYFVEGQRAVQANDHAAAVKLWQKAHDAMLQIKDPNPAILTRVDAQLGEALSEDGRSDEAISMLEDVRKKATATFGSAHPETIFTRVILVEAETQARHYADAQRELNTLRPDIVRVLGQDSQWLLNADEYQAEIWAGQGLWSKTLPLYEDDYQHAKSLIGAGNPMTIEVGTEYADSARLGGDVGRATQLLNEVDSAVKTLPADAATPLRAQIGLEQACVLVTQGHAGKAREFAATLDQTIVERSDPSGRSLKRLKGLLQINANGEAQQAACSK